MIITENQDVHEVGLREQFEGQAAWRREKALQYPNDRRNADAVATFARLARSVAKCPRDVVEAADELLVDTSDFEEWHDMMKWVGFHYFPDSAEEFCRDFISNRTAGR